MCRFSGLKTVCFNLAVASKEEKKSRLNLCSTLGKVHSYKLCGATETMLLVLCSGQECYCKVERVK